MENLDGFVPVLEEKKLQEGKMRLVIEKGTPILFIKQEGQIFVINNLCPHMSCGFSCRTLNGLVIVCPCHDWHFDLTTGYYQDGGGFKLTKYDWKIKSGKICVKLDEEP